MRASWNESIHVVLRSDPESLGKTLCDRVKVRVKVRVWAVMDRCLKHVFRQRAAFYWIHMGTQSVS